MNKAKKILLVTAVVIVALIVGRVIVLNSMATNGIELSTMQEELQAVKRENIILQEQLLHYSSLTNIASEAATLGFELSKTELLLIQAPQVALR